MHNKPFLVLGTYHPDDWRCFKIGKALTKFTSKLGYSPLIDPIHGPQTWVPWYNEELHAEVKRRTPKAKKGEDWHQDGDLDPGANMNHGLILWSNITPTEFKINEKIYQPNPYEVVFFKNLSGFHRRPLNAPRHRFLFRQRVTI